MSRPRPEAERTQRAAAASLWPRSHISFPFTLLLRKSSQGYCYSQGWPRCAQRETGGASGRVRPAGRRRQCCGQPGYGNPLGFGVPLSGRHGGGRVLLWRWARPPAVTAVPWERWRRRTQPERNERMIKCVRLLPGEAREIASASLFSIFFFKSELVNQSLGSTPRGGDIKTQNERCGQAGPRQRAE